MKTQTAATVAHARRDPGTGAAAGDSVSVTSDRNANDRSLASYAPINDPLHVLGHITPSLEEGCGSAAEDGRGTIRLRVTAEGPSSAERLVQETSEGEDVGAVVDGLAADLFRRHVTGSAQDGSGTRGHRSCGEFTGVRGAFFRLNGLCQPEIENLRQSTVGEEHVLRFQVAVNDSCSVCRGQRVGDGGADFYRLPPVQWPLPETLSEVFAFEQFGDRKGDVALGSKIMDFQARLARGIPLPSLPHPAAKGSHSVRGGHLGGVASPFSSICCRQYRSFVVALAIENGRSGTETETETGTVRLFLEAIFRLCVCLSMSSSLIHC
jgi:hypothetical protein